MKKIGFLLGLTMLISTAAIADSTPNTQTLVVGNLHVQDTWLLSDNGIEALFKPDTFLSNGKPIAADRTLYLEYHKGIFIHKKIPFSELKSFTVQVTGKCANYYFTKTDGEVLSTFGCGHAGNFFIHAYKGSDNWVAVTSVTGTEVNVKDGRRYPHASYPFDMDSFQSFAVLSSEELKTKQTETEANRQRKIAEYQNLVQAHLQAEKKRLQAEKDKQVVLSALGRAKIGTEDSCESHVKTTVMYTTWENYGDYAHVDCQLSGNGLQVKDFKDSGWLVTNVQRIGEHRFMMTVKKVK